ncbi:MAG: hypothetical protein HKN92_00790 [Chitinophagales bacterium]|nr:hypothetical protein [Chitinophagales bacterium]
MKTFYAIKEYFHKVALNKQLKTVVASRDFVNMENARSVGILYDATLPNNNIIVTKFAEKLKLNNKKVNVLGYVDDKKSETHPLNPLFNNKDLNWFLLPSNDKIKHFINEEFDILINAFIGERLPLEYISALSKAKYRVGPYSESKTHCYELMINMGEKQDLQYLLDQISFYLKVFNKKDAISA